MSAELSYETQSDNFTSVCLGNPWRTDGIESLVYVDDKGKVSGFIAIIPRKMKYRDRSIMVATLQHLMVDPDSRSPFAALELFKAALAGKQDLSVSDRSVDISKKLWELCGGKTAYAYSTYWKSSLRPFTFSIMHLGEHYDLVPAAKAVAPMLRVVDAGFTRLPWTPWKLRPLETIEKEITTEELVSLIHQFSARYSLRPECDVQSLDWLLSIVAKQTRWGSLQRCAVQSADGQTLGWFIYYLNRIGSSEVVQIGARENTAEFVISHLIYHAWTRGAIQLAGRMNPHFTRAFTRKVFWFFPGLDWMLVHSRDPELLQPLLLSDAWWTRLDGDLWLL